jgi:hypothetical protein
VPQNPSLVIHARDEVSGVLGPLNLDANGYLMVTHPPGAPLTESTQVEIAALKEHVAALEARIAVLEARG